MFDNLRDAFREAVANFKEELNRDEVPEVVDRLFLGMKHELNEAHELLAGLEEQIEQARAQVRKDQDEEALYRRRGEMASKVGDGETARIALEFAVKSERRRIVIERKIVALDEERRVRVVEIEEMTVHFTEAQQKRDDLAATAGSSDTNDAIRAADEIFEELDRMAGDVDEPGGTRAASDAYRPSNAMDDLEREFRELRVDPRAPVPRREIDPDAALEELKRRMQQSDPE